ncbi:MAG TPA: YraN family protein [Fimbriimonadaceae bacterium]|nr:YraN family protein [Fimbriimonadaceae bacterium]
MSGVRRLGAESEDAAAAYLLQLGYTLVTRRFKASRGEIDLIALDGETLVFVEVKTRRQGFAAAHEAVDAKKRERLAHAAEEYLDRVRDRRHAARFDVILIDGQALHHEIDAFRVP